MTSPLFPCLCGANPALSLSTARAEFHANNWGRRPKPGHKRKVPPDEMTDEADGGESKGQSSGEGAAEANNATASLEPQPPVPIAAQQDVVAAENLAQQLLAEGLLDKEAVAVMTHAAYTTAGANGQMYPVADLAEYASATTPSFSPFPWASSGVWPRCYLYTSPTLLSDYRPFRALS